MRFTAILVVLGALLGSNIGCGSSEFVRTGDPLVDLESPDPLIVEYACATAANTGNLDTIPALIANLRHDVPHIRMLSIFAIYDLLGIDPAAPPFQEIVYGWADTPSRREQAVLAWEEWFRIKGKQHIEEEKLRRKAAKSSPKNPG